MSAIHVARVHWSTTADYNKLVWIAFFLLARSRRVRSVLAETFTRLPSSTPIIHYLITITRDASFVRFSVNCNRPSACMTIQYYDFFTKRRESRTRYGQFTIEHGYAFFFIHLPVYIYIYIRSDLFSILSCIGYV